MKLSKKEQKNLKAIEDEIAGKIKNFQQNYANITMQDCLAMICIEQAFTIYNNKDNKSDVAQDVLSKIEQALAK